MTDWQPIESAPRDGTWILLFDAGYDASHHSYMIAHWHGLLKCWAGKANSKSRFPIWEDATHWMPLPAPPEVSS